MGIAKGKLRQPPRILITNIEAPDVTDLTIKHYNLPVVTVVQPEVKEVVVGQQELRGMTAAFSQAIMKLWRTPIDPRNTGAGPRPLQQPSARGSG